MRKRITWLGALGLAVVTILVVGLLSWMTGGFRTFDKESIAKNTAKPLNPDNLFTAECVTLEDMNDGYGIVIDVKDNGSISLKGTATADKSYEIGKVELDEGTYTVTALEGAGMNTAFVTVSIGENTYYADLTGENGRTIAIANDGTEVTLTLYVMEDAVLNTTVYPVIVEGEEPGRFFK